MSSYSRLKQQGLSLIELMVGITIGFMVVLAAVGTIAVTRTSGSTVSDQAELASRANLILQQMAFFIRQTGGVEVTPRNAALANALQSFDVGNVATVTAPTFISGVNGTGSAADEITVAFQHRSDATTRDCLGNTPAAGTWVTNRFYLNGTTLMCRGNVANAAQPLADNIEDLQLRYLVQNGTDAATTSQWQTANAVTNWNNVTAVEICIQLRGYMDYGNLMTGQFTNCAGNATNNSQFLRLVLRQTVQMRNRANNLG